MIPYQDLVDALASWRASKGLAAGASVGASVGASAGPSIAPSVRAAAAAAAPAVVPAPARTAPSAPPPPARPAASAPAPPPLAPPEESLDVAETELLEETYETAGGADFAMSFDAGAAAAPRAPSPAMLPPLDHDGESTAIGAPPGPGFGRAPSEVTEDADDATMIGHDDGHR
jgi:hypothetical protein